MWVAVGACALTLIAGYLFKAQCTVAEGWDGRQYERLCYNDVQALYAARGIDRDVFPYVDGRLTGADELVDGAIEYPVLTGLAMWAAGLFVDDFNSYLSANAALLAPFALGVAYLLAVMRGPRALMWAAAPALVLYAFHNWDLYAVAAAMFGFWLWWRGASARAVVAFAVGAAFKMYPAIFVLPVAIAAARERGWRAGARLAALGAATWAAINLPIALVNPEGWFATYSFHSQRTGNFDSMWNLGFPGIEPASLNLLTLGLTLGSFAGAIWWGLRRARPGTFPVVGVSAACLAAFLLWNKVHSPQYTLWLLPLLALSGVSWRWWAAYSLADIAVYVGVFRWFYDYLYRGMDDTFMKSLMTAGVWARAALLAALFVAFLRDRDDRLGTPSHPVPNVVPGEQPAA